MQYHARQRVLLRPDVAPLCASVHMADSPKADSHGIILRTIRFPLSIPWRIEQTKSSCHQKAMPRIPLIFEILHHKEALSIIADPSPHCTTERPRYKAATADCQLTFFETMYIFRLMERLFALKGNWGRNGSSSDRKLLVSDERDP